MLSVLLVATLVSAPPVVQAEPLDFSPSGRKDRTELELARDEDGDFHLSFELTWDEPGRVLTVPDLMTISVVWDGYLRIEAAGANGEVVLRQGRIPIPQGKPTRIAISAALDVFTRISIAYGDQLHFAAHELDPSAVRAERLVLGWMDDAPSFVVEEAPAFEGELRDLRVRPGAKSTRMLLHEIAPEAPTPRRAVYADAEAWGDATREFFAIEGDTLVWAPAQWREDPVPPGPVARTATPQVMLPDGRIVAFSGEVRDTHHHPMDTTRDTWIYDPATSSWTEIVSEERPWGRSHQGMAYDRSTDRVLMLGGWDNGMGRSGHPNDLWALNVDAGRWAKVSESTELLFPHADFAYLYHPRYDTVLAFGNRRPWLLGKDPATPQPLPKYPEGLASRPSRSAGYVLDPQTDRIWFFGGTRFIKDEEGRFPYVDLTQHWDPATETLVTIDVEPHPTPRGRPLIGFDPELRRILMFGGSVTQAIRRGDFWTFDVDEEVWREHRQADCPGPRGGFMVPSFDVQRGELVMVLGRSSRPRFHEDVWRLRFDPEATGSLELELDRTLLPDARGVELILSSVWQADVQAELTATDANAVRVRLTASSVDEHNAVRVERVALAAEAGAALPGETRLWLPLAAQ